MKRFLAFIMAVVITAGLFVLPASAATTVKLSASKITIEVGETYKLSVSTNGTGTKAWATSNKAVATVKSGTVTALKEGTATIKVRIDGVIASCGVTVTKATPKPGNTPSNISNGGFAAKAGDWIYFANYNDNQYLYKMKADGTGKTKIRSDKCAYINVIGTTIYYQNLSDEGYIYKINTDGTGRKAVLKEYSYDILVDDNTIYRSKSNDSHTKMTLTAKDEVSLVNTRSAVIDKGYIYFTDYSAAIGGFLGLYRDKINEDGINWDNEIVLLDGSKTLSSSTAFAIDGNYAYYAMREETGEDVSLYRVKLDGTGTKKIANLGELSVAYFNISNGWIYYPIFDHKNGTSTIYKINTDGKSKTKLASLTGRTHGINVTGDFIFLNHSPDNNSGTAHILYKMKNNGSGLAKV